MDIAQPGATSAADDLDCCYVLKRFPQLTQTFVAEELSELARQGLRCAVVARRGPSSTTAPAAAPSDLPVHHLDDRAPEQDLVRWVRRHRPRHLHAHFAGWAARAAATAARQTGIGYSFTAHATDIYRRDVDERQLAGLMTGADFVVTVTEANRQHLLAVLAREGATARVVRIYNGVDLRRLSPGTGDRDADHIVCVGRLVEKKGHDVLLEAVRRIRGRGRDLRVTIVGEGPLHEALDKQVADAGLVGTVHLAGELDRGQVLALVARATVLVLPCTLAADGDRDALPTVLLEAMALGTPVLSTTVSGIPEMVDDDVSGLLVPSRDPAALAAALLRLLDDADLRARLAQRARVRVQERFDLQASAAALHGLLSGRT